MKRRSLMFACVLCLLVALPLVLGACHVHEHVYQDEWSANDTYHWHAAACNHPDVISDKAEHDWDAGTVTKEPTKDAEGILKRTCTVCGQSKEETLPKKGDGHVHSYTQTVVQPTCTDDGYTLHTCDCGHTYTDAKTNALGHSVSSWTTNSDGTHSGVCSRAGHTVTEACTYSSAVTAPTCTAQGYTTYTCTCGHSYRDNYAAPTGHQYHETMTYNDSYHWYDANCSHTEEKSSYEKHTFTAVVTAPTCTAQGYTTYTCACGYHYQGDITAATGHNVQTWTESEATLSDASNCEYQIVYSGECTNCHLEQSKTEYLEKHSYYWAITTPASCQGEGIKTKLCNHTECQYHTASADSETQRFTDNNAHTWIVDEEASSASVSAYKCYHDDCQATKKVMNVVDTSVDVSDSDLNDITEVEFPDATVGLDEGIKNTLAGKENISISASTLSDGAKQDAIENAALSEEELALLGDNPVYNFTITADTVISNLGGTATIRIPYTLSAGQNPEQIVVWYISEGKLEAIEATYSEDAGGNGYVTFTTTHFSYYAPAELTPEQYCATFGHSDELYTVAPTCFEGGYVICKHCGKQISYTAPMGHNWQSSVTTETGCGTNGVMHFECGVCDAEYDSVIPATGHYYVLHDYQGATCQASGHETHRCIYCEDSYTISLPQVSHNHVSTVIAPTCTTAGYTQKTCTVCGDTIISNSVSPKGHTFASGWNAAEEGHCHVCTVCGERDALAAHTPGAAATETTAQICTVCEYVITPPLAHTHSLTAVAAVAADCTHGGNVAYYTCTCGKWFLDEQAQMLITEHSSVILLAKGHTPVAMDPVTPTCTEIGYTAGIECSVCHTILSGHVQIDAYGHRHAATVTAPTCTEGGHTVYLCACGDTYTADETEALGHHLVSSVTAPTCTESGHTTSHCTRCSFSEITNEVEPLGHTPAPELVCDENGHRIFCAHCGEKLLDEAHVPDYEEATAAHGVKCTVCGYVIEKKLEHVHAVSKKVDGKAPTCTATGIREYYICDCGAWFKDADCTEPLKEISSVVIPALGHSVTVIEGVESTCQKPGYSKSEYCEVCGTWVVKAVELPLAEHQYENGACKVCGDLEVTEPEIDFTSRIEEIERAWNTLYADYDLENALGKDHEYCKKYETLLALMHKATVEADFDKLAKEIEALMETIKAELGGDGEDTEEKKTVYVFEAEMEVGFVRYEFYSDGTMYGYLKSVGADGTVSKDEVTANWKLDGKEIVLIYNEMEVQRFTIADDGKTLIPVERPDPSTCPHENTEKTVEAPTCTEEGFERVTCKDCGSGWGTTIPALGHSFVNGVCGSCGATEGSAEDITELITVYEKMMIDAWTERYEKFASEYMSVFKMYEMQYKMLLENLRSATAADVVEKTYSEFEQMLKKIDETIGKTDEPDVPVEPDDPEVPAKELYTFNDILTDTLHANIVFRDDYVAEGIFTTYAADGTSIDEEFSVNWGLTSDGCVQILVNGSTYKFAICEDGGLKLESIQDAPETDAVQDKINSVVAEMNKTWREYSTNEGFTSSEIYVEYKDRFFKLQEQIQVAKSLEEIDKIYAEVENLVAEIEKYLGTTTECKHENTEKTYTAPTCTEEGFERVTCKDCKNSWTVSIPALGHSFVNGVCGSCGATEGSAEDITELITVYEKMMIDAW
ncbi:MAG: hypothetical protein J6B71_09965, partial [Clostridia bacterium]|nr:hypothetical protein [Clostridia bacterium]